MIEAERLTRSFGDLVAVDGVSFSVGEGEIVGMLGPNGAGKTTTIRMVTGFLPPSGGRVRIGGSDLFSDPVKVRRHVGYLPENVALYPEMRVSEYLAYRARLEGIPSGDAKRRIGRAVERCLLTEVATQIIGTLSKGYRQRVGLAAAILHRPKALVLDEPTVGLDPAQIIKIRELIRELSSESTLLLSTHILPEVELLCGRVMIIDRGRIVAEGTPESLREGWLGSAGIELVVKDAPEEAAPLLSSVPGVAAVRPDSVEAGRYHVEAAPGADPREEIFLAVRDRGWVLLEMVQARASLEDVFVRLTTREPGAPPDAAPREEVAS